MLNKKSPIIIRKYLLNIVPDFVEHLRGHHNHVGEFAVEPQILEHVGEACKYGKYGENLIKKLLE